MSEKKKLAVVFPGIGYHVDKPLLYYGRKLLQEKDYQVVLVPYRKFPKNVKGNEKKMRVAFKTAWKQTEKILSSIDFSEYDTIVFLSKSIGTKVAVDYAAKYHLPAYQILYTPLNVTFENFSGEAVAFHGTADDWADTKEIQEQCRKLQIPLFLTEGANHSLECPKRNVKENLEIIQKVMEQTKWKLDLL